MILGVVDLTDCTLAMTGGGVSWVWVVLAAVLLGVGVVLTVLSRGRGTAARGAALAALVLMVGVVAGVAGPVSSAEAAVDCSTPAATPVPVPVPVDAEVGTWFSEASVNVGGSVTHTVLVSNATTVPTLAGLQVSIPKVAGATVASYSGTDWSLVSDTATEFVYEYAPVIGVGASATPLVGTVTATTIGTYILPVSIVAGTGGDTVTSNNSASVPLTVVGAVDLAVDVTSAKAFIFTDDDTDVFYTVTNVGTAATSATVTLTTSQSISVGDLTLLNVPTGWVLTSQSGYTYTFTNASDVLDPGESVIFTFNYYATAILPGNIMTFTGEVATPDDVNPANDTDSVPVQVRTN